MIVSPFPICNPFSFTDWILITWGKNKHFAILVYLSISIFEHFFYGIHVNQYDPIIQDFQMEL